MLRPLVAEHRINSPTFVHAVLCHSMPHTVLLRQRKPSFQSCAQEPPTARSSLWRIYIWARWKKLLEIVLATLFIVGSLNSSTASTTAMTNAYM